MSIQYQILGRPGRDNSLSVKVDSGNRLYRILIDCGENTVSGINQSDIKSTDILLLSHLHLDHIAGFDYLFRRTFDRSGEFLNIFGPEETSAILHHRFSGYKWNITEGLSGGYLVNDISKDIIQTYRFSARLGFSDREHTDSTEHNGIILDNPDFRISAAPLNHRIPSMGYNIRETDSINVDKRKLVESSLTSGPWLSILKDKNISDDVMITINEQVFQAGHLRKELLVTTPGESITYLTDFIYDEQSLFNAVRLASGSDVLICESQYIADDEPLAIQNYHLTSVQAAHLAKKAGVKKMILFHISERYIHNREKMIRMLEEARSIFPETYFPEHWKL